jgi:hypothetical protein
MREFRTDHGDRRSLLAAVASGAVASVAGCLGSAERSDDEDRSTSEEPTFPDHPIDEPRDPPENRRCDGPCGMSPSEHPEWNAQLAHEGGLGVFFDTPGCLLTYRHAPTFYGGAAAPIENAWVRDFKTKELIDATAAVLVLDYDKQRLEDEPMAHNPRPFLDRSDAVAYVDSHDDLSEGDITGIDGFGAEQAHRYRDYPIPEDDP